MLCAKLAIFVCMILPAEGIGLRVCKQHACFHRNLPSSERASHMHCLLDALLPEHRCGKSQPPAEPKNNKAPLPSPTTLRSLILTNIPVMVPSKGYWSHPTFETPAVTKIARATRSKQRLEECRANAVWCKSGGFVSQSRPSILVASSRSAARM